MFRKLVGKLLEKLFYIIALGTFICLIAGCMGLWENFQYWWPHELTYKEMALNKPKSGYLKIDSGRINAIDAGLGETEVTVGFKGLKPIIKRSRGEFYVPVLNPEAPNDTRVHLILNPHSSELFQVIKSLHQLETKTQNAETLLLVAKNLDKFKFTRPIEGQIMSLDREERLTFLKNIENVALDFIVIEERKPDYSKVLYGFGLALILGVISVGLAYIGAKLNPDEDDEMG